MKIGFDGKRFFHNTSGLGNYSRDLLRILAGQLPENEYYLFDREPSERGRETLALPNVHFSPVPSGLFARQLQAGREACAAGCDIFHGLSGELPLRWENPKIRKVVTIHDLIFRIYPQYYSFFDREIHFRKFRNAALQADAVVAISEQTRTDIVRYLEIPEDKIHVIYQGCSPLFKKQYTEEEKKQVKDKYGLPEKFLLNVGTIEERKNGLSVAEAVRGTGIPLVFIGRETAYADAIRKTADHRQVRFLKNVSNEELAVIYRLATVFIYPSVYEGFGIPIIEALFSGTPVITNKDGVFPEAGGSSAVYVDIRDTAGMQAEILRLWNDPDLRKRLAEAGTRFVQKFSDEVLAEEWKQLYRGLLM
ncbi:glycosyltransferase family 4 protein [Leadbetterella sp. DM7]|uniref:glycosyltransferase family 4 protein n=1 Tax=Leadbetterella sp. DM7 TaxID=3235085 RepID=UPI00349EDE35